MRDAVSGALRSELAGAASAREAAIAPSSECDQTSKDYF